MNWSSFLSAPNNRVYIDNSTYLFGSNSAQAHFAYLTVTSFVSFTNITLGIMGFVQNNGPIPNKLHEFYIYCKKMRANFDANFRANPQVLTGDWMDLPTNYKLALRFFHVLHKNRLHSLEVLSKFATFLEFDEWCDKPPSLTEQCLALMPLDVQHACRARGPIAIHEEDWAFNVVLSGSFKMQKIEVATALYITTYRFDRQIPTRQLAGKFESNSKQQRIRYDWHENLEWWCEINLAAKRIEGRGVPVCGAVVVVDSYETAAFSVIRWQSKIDVDFWAKVVVFKDHKLAAAQRRKINPEVL